MNRERFWALIQETHPSSGGRAGAQLLARLRELPRAEIAAFQDVRDDLLAESYRRDLWGAAYLINRGCSDDGFDYFRAWLLGQGNATFQTALRDPDGLAGHPEVQDVISAGIGRERLECESLLAAPFWAYEAATGHEP